MRYLILLDRKFPFKSGESFLENEIDEISSHFDKVLIFPSDASKNDQMTRKINSKNIEVCTPETLDFSKRKYIYALKAIMKLNNSEKKLACKFEEAFFNVAVNEQFKKVAKELKKINFHKEDNVYVYSYWLYINAGVAIKLKSFFEDNNINCIAFSRAHRFDIYEENRKNSFLPARKHLLHNLNNVYACSDDGTKYLKEKYPQYAKKINTGYLGTYDHGIGKASEDNVFRIVSCSRVSEVKRINLIIEALEILEKTDVNISWTHIGGGELLDEMKKMALSKLKKIDYSFLGAVPNTKVYDYYLNNPVDLFVNVSSSEGLPVSIMEASSFGIPVVATDVGGTSEIIFNKNDYLLNKNFSPKELANKIKKIKKLDNTKYQKLRSNSRKLWEEKYQAKNNYKKFIENILK